MAEWKTAGQIPNLFPEEDAPAIVVSKEPAETDPFAPLKINVSPAGKKGVKAKAPASVAESLDSLKVDVAAAGQKAASKVKSHARTAGKVAALSAERAKISTVTLPIAYAELGEHCYRSRTYAEEFAELFTKLDAVSAGIAASEQPAEVGGDTIAEKAKAWAEQGMKFAQSQAQGVQAKTLFVQLGKACFNRFGPESGPEELVTRIQALRDRLSTLDAEVKTGVKKTGGVKGWLMYGGGALMCLMLISSCFSERDPGGGGGSGGGGGGTAIRPLARDLPRDPEMRDAYENGWERGAKHGNEWLSAMREHAEGQSLQEYARANSWVVRKKDGVLARPLESVETNQQTLVGLVSENAEPFLIKAVQARIHEAKGYHDGFKVIAEAGLNGKDTSNVTTAQANTTTLTVAEARRLIQRDSWLVIKNPTTISDDVAEVLAQFPLGLDLIGVSTLSESALETLARKPAGHLRLGGLKSLSDKAAKALSQNRSPVMVLDSVPAISDKAAALLAQHPGTLLSLKGLKKLSVPAAKALSSYEGDLHLDGLIELTPELAETLAKHRGDLSLKGVATISSEVSEKLAQHKGALYLDGLKTLSSGAAKAFARHWGALSFDGLATLTPEVAEPLVQATGELSLNGLAVPSMEVASVLARHQNRLYLKGLNVDKLPEEVKKVLRRHRRISLPDNRFSL
jgi:hypothetical protein